MIRVIITIYKALKNSDKDHDVFYTQNHTTEYNIEFMKNKKCGKIQDEKNVKCVKISEYLYLNILFQNVIVQFTYEIIFFIV